MASQAKRNQKRSSPAARRPRAPRQTAQQKRKAEDERALGIAVGYVQNFEAQRAQLVAQRARIDEQIEDNNKRLQQAVGRVETIQEMLGLIDPLPALASPQRPPSPQSSDNGGEPADKDGKEG